MNKKQLKKENISLEKSKKKKKNLGTKIFVWALVAVMVLSSLASAIAMMIG